MIAQRAFVGWRRMVLMGRLEFILERLPHEKAPGRFVFIGATSFRSRTRVTFRSERLFCLAGSYPLTLPDRDYTWMMRTLSLWSCHGEEKDVVRLILTLIRIAEWILLVDELLGWRNDIYKR